MWQVYAGTRIRTHGGKVNYDRKGGWNQVAVGDTAHVMYCTYYSSANKTVYGNVKKNLQKTCVLVNQSSRGWADDQMHVSPL